MDTSFFHDMLHIIIERLGLFYNRDAEYTQALKEETELSKQLEEVLPEDTMQLFKEYQNTVYKTWGICEMIAYRQGMRDIMSLLGIKSGGV